MQYRLQLGLIVIMVSLLWIRAGWWVKSLSRRVVLLQYECSWWPWLTRRTIQDACSYVVYAVLGNVDTFILRNSRRMVRVRDHYTLQGKEPLYIRSSSKKMHYCSCLEHMQSNATTSTISFNRKRDNIQSLCREISPWKCLFCVNDQLTVQHPTYYMANHQINKGTYWFELR